MQYIFHEELRARSWPVLIIFCLCSLPLILARLLDGSNKGIDYIIVGSLVIVGLLYVAVRKMKIVLDNEGFEVCNLMKTKKVSWKTIIDSRLSFEFSAHTADIKWEFQLREGNRFSFSPTFYSRSDLRKIAEALIEKSPDAIISDKVRRMGEGKFPWYIF